MEEEILGIITLPFFYFFTFFLLKLKNSPPLPQLQQVTPPDTWLKIISIYGGKLMNEGIFFLKDLRPDFYSTLPITLKELHHRNIHPLFEPQPPSSLPLEDLPLARTRANEGYTPMIAIDAYQ